MSVPKTAPAKRPESLGSARVSLENRGTKETEELGTEDGEEEEEEIDEIGTRLNPFCQRGCYYNRR